MTAEVISIHTDHSNAKNLRAETEMLDYLIWSITHSKDPHDLHDDPIEVFRKAVHDSLYVA